MAEKKDIGEKLADKQWVDIQRKTFTKWCNSHVVKKHGNASAISNLEKDFQNGNLESLCRILIFFKELN
jgi:hypothetical protein